MESPSFDNITINIYGHSQSARYFNFIHVMHSLFSRVYTCIYIMYVCTHYVGLPCESYQFTCDNGSCVSFDYECDDSDDCRDNSNKEGCGTVINFLHLIILLPITQLLLLTTINIKTYNALSNQLLCFV